MLYKFFGVGPIRSSHPEGCGLLPEDEGRGAADPQKLVEENLSCQDGAYPPKNCKRKYIPTSSVSCGS